MIIYTNETKIELEKSVRSIEGVTNILWRDDTWEGCACLLFKVGASTFKISFTNRGIPVAYYYLNGYWRIDVIKGDYSPLDVKNIVYELCMLLDTYDTEETRAQIIDFSKSKEYMNNECVDELEEERVIRRLAGAFMRDHKMEADREGILLQVVVALCNDSLVSYYTELERIKNAKRKRRRELKRVKEAIHKHKEIRNNE